MFGCGNLGMIDQAIQSVRIGGGGVTPPAMTTATVDFEHTAETFEALCGHSSRIRCWSPPWGL